MNRVILTIVALFGLNFSQSNLPNVVLMMADDLGYGDVGYNGNTSIKTPTLDEMASKGIQFNRFYSASAVCSPTRAAVMTGRNPIRVGVPNANSGHLPPEEITIAEAVKSVGYRTGHFGKWHLGTLTKLTNDANRGGPGGVAHYSVPWENGFDSSFSTESKVPTWDPMIKPPSYSGWESSRNGWYDIGPNDPSEPYNTRYWDREEHAVTENLEGDNSRVIMDRAVSFVQQAAQDKVPFLAIIWFHTPHLPVVVGQSYIDAYAAAGVTDPYTQVYYGSITAMDEQIGRLRTELRNLNIADNTMLFFTSDNGPENNTPGSAGDLRARKRSFYEGGIRVPSVWEWPAKMATGKATEVPVHSSDYYPTILEAIGFTVMEQTSPMDGESFMGLLNDSMTERADPMGFILSNQLAYIDNQYKIRKANATADWELFDITADKEENNDLAASNPTLLNQMIADFTTWRNQQTVYDNNCCTPEWIVTPINQIKAEFSRTSPLDVFDVSGNKIGSFDNSQSFKDWNAKAMVSSSKRSGIVFLKSKNGGRIMSVFIK